MELGAAFLDLLCDPVWVVALGHRGVNCVLHRVLKIRAVNRHRDIQVTGIDDDDKNYNGDNKLQARAAALAAFQCYSLVIHDRYRQMTGLL